MQVDPLSMMLHNAVAVLPLMEDSRERVQNRYTDDSSCIGELSSVMKWFDRLLTDGPTYGQLPEPSKTALVVQSSDLERANDLSMILVFVGSLLYDLLVDLWGEQPLGTDFISNEVEV